MEFQTYLRHTGVMLAMLTTAVLSACGGGGGGVATSTNGGGSTVAAAVSLPSSASSLTSKTNTNAVASLAGVSAAYRALSSGTVRAFTAPTTSDYATDTSNTWVQVEGQESLDTINEILCYLGQAAPDLVLTADGATATYAAKINATTCSSRSGGGSGTGSSATGSKGSKFATMTLTATPKTTTADETVKFWMDLPADGQQKQRVHGLITATSGVSSTNPFGVWVFNYDMEMETSPGTWVAVNNGSNAASGTLQATEVNGQPELLMYEDMAAGSGPGSFVNATAVKVRYDVGSKTAGQANMHDSHTDSFGNSSSNNVLAFNTDYAYVGKDTDGNSTIDANICRDRVNFTDHVFRYNLYHATAGTVDGNAVTTGERVNLNTGFPFKTSTGVNGFASNWGAWLDDGTALTDGAVINRMDNFSTGATSQVTAHVSTGRLEKQVIVNQTLADIAGIDFQYDNGSGSSYKAHIDATSGHLIATATITWGAGLTETPLSPVMDLTNGTNTMDQFVNLNPFGAGNFYSFQLAPTTAPTLTTVVQSISSEPVSGGDAALAGGLTLYCWSNCPTGGNSATLHDTSGSWNFGTSNQTYTATATSGVVTVTDDSNSTAVTGNSTNPVNMWQLTSTATAPWGTGASTTQYNYSAGNGWDTMVTFTNNADSSVVAFDQPLNFSGYAHATANDRNNDATYNGKTFPLSFDGFQLQGFPWIPDPDGTGWMLSAVDLKDGVQLTDANSNAYIVRGMDIQQVPNLVSGSTCTTAGLDTAGILTSLPLPTAADMTAVPTTWADKPTITTGPRVVEGVLQF